MEARGILESETPTATNPLSRDRSRMVGRRDGGDADLVVLAP